MKFKTNQDTTARVKFALDKSEIEIRDFVSAKFAGYENDREVHWVEGLNFCEPGEPNFRYEIHIKPATGEAYFWRSNLTIQAFLDEAVTEIN